MSNQTIAASRNIFASRTFFLQRHWRSIWAIVFLGSMNLVLRDATTIKESAFTMAVMHRIFAVGFVGLIILLPALTRPRIIFRGISVSLIAFSLWRITSFLWSEAPLWTLYRSIEYALIVTLTAYTVALLKSLADLKTWLTWIWSWIGVLVASSYVGILFFPEEALIPVSGAFLPVMLQGVLPRINPNGLGQMGGIIALVGISRWIGMGKQNKWIFLVLFGILTMFLSQGRVAIAGFLIGYLVILLCHGRIGVVLGICLLSLTIYISGAWEYLWTYYRRGQSFEIFMSLSTRYDWWQSVWEYVIRDNVFIGHGAFAGGRLLSPIETGEYSRLTVDNAWLELITDTGIMGFCLFLLPSLWTCKILVSNSIKGNVVTRALSIECLAILILILFRSFFVSSITLHNAFFFFACWGCAEFLRFRRN